MTSLFTPPDAPPPGDDGATIAAVRDVVAPSATGTAPVPLADDGHAGAIRPIATRPLPARSGRADRAARALLLRLLGHLRGGRLTIIEADGTVTTHGDTEPGPGGLDVTLRLHTSAVWREVATKASRGLGESYVDGWWSTDDLVALVQLLIRNLDAFDDIRNRWDRVTSPVADTWRKLRPASRLRDRREIAAHYDLGNGFFELFLDQTMAYSCGLYASPEVSLEDAQRAKFDRLLRSIDVGSDDHLVEIGTGWGGLAVHAAQHYGCRVTTTTISVEQHRHAAELVASLGLSDQVEVLLSDYRDLTGTFGKLVSVEMIEAVDWRDHDAYFATCQRLLKPDGRMALQAITVADRRFHRVRNSEDFVKRHIFPGSCIPSIDAITGATTRVTDFWLTSLEEFPQHYAETLRRWRERLWENEVIARDRGYDDALMRLWDFYLAYCEGAFRERYVSLVQCVFTRAGSVPSSLTITR